MDLPSAVNQHAQMTKVQSVRTQLPFPHTRPTQEEVAETAAELGARWAEKELGRARHRGLRERREAEEEAEGARWFEDSSGDDDGDGDTRWIVTSSSSDSDGD